jgi:alanine racemase
MQNRTWVEISQSAIKKNIAGYTKLLPDETSIMAVVKANAYGHGLQIVSDIAVESGIDELSVFTLDEALKIRQTHKDTPILVLNQINIDELDIALKYNIDITVSSIETLKKIIKYKKVKELLINLKIDTGLSRQGFQFSDLPNVIKILKSNEHINISGLYTHLIGAENKKFDKYTNNQIHEINNWQDELNSIGYYPLVHVSATAGFLMNEKISYDSVRMGIGLYGLWPSNEVKEKNTKTLNLYPALSWKTKINQVKKIKKGDVVGYDATFVASGDMTIAVVPVGYFDGLPRSLSNKGYMLCGGVKCKILGRVMMNMCVIDVSSALGAKMGDEIVIIGKQKNTVITAEEIADIAGTINYEIVTRINSEIPRIAIK